MHPTGCQQICRVGQPGNKQESAQTVNNKNYAAATIITLSGNKASWQKTFHVTALVRMPVDKGDFSEVVPRVWGI